MSQVRMSVEEFRSLSSGKGASKRGGRGPRTSRGRKQSEYAARFAVTPPRTAEEVSGIETQRPLFEVHEQVKVSLRLPLPPSVNAYWRTFVLPGSQHANTYVSEEGKAYHAAVKAAWLAHFKGWPPEPLTGPLRLFVLVHYYDAREIDLDNRVKALQDALAGARAFVNDTQIKHLSVREGPIIKPFGCVDVWLETIEGKI